MAARLLTSYRRPEMRKFLESFDTVLTDCDGVLWDDMQLIDGSLEVIHMLKSNGKKVFYITNNATKSTPQFFEKFKKLDFPIEEHELYSSAYMTAKYLRKQNMENKKAYLVATEGLGDELDLMDIRHFGSGPDPMIHPPNFYEWFSKMHLEPDVGAVVVGLDWTLSYVKLLKASSYLMDKSCLFIATNTDEVMPTRRGLTIPDCGSIVAAVQYATGRKPIVMGKPSPEIFKSIQHDHEDVVPERTIMIGDRGNTDILFGANCGLRTILVLSGITTMQEVNTWKMSPDPEQRKQVPDFYLQKLGDWLTPLKHIYNPTKM